MERENEKTNKSVSFDDLENIRKELKKQKSWNLNRQRKSDTYKTN